MLTINIIKAIVKWFVQWDKQFDFRLRSIRRRLITNDMSADDVGGMLFVFLLSICFIVTSIILPMTVAPLTTLLFWFLTLEFINLVILFFKPVVDEEEEAQ